MAQLFTLPRPRPLTSAGKVMPASKLYFNLVGTSTLGSVWSDADCTVEHTNPVIADANGEFDAIYLSGPRDATLKTSAGVLVWGPETVGITPGVDIDVADYGAVGDGVTDDSTAIQAAITAAQTAGGGTVRIRRGVYNITSTLYITDDNIFLDGDGGVVDGNVAYVGGMTAAIAAATTRLVWNGLSGGTLILMRPSPDDGTKAPLNGGGIRNMCLDGNSIANDILDVRSLRNSEFENLLIARGNSVNLKVGVNNNNTIGGNKSLAFCVFRNVQVTNSTLSGTAKTMVCYGHITDGNVAINEFDNCGFYNENGTGSHIEMENCDSNTFTHCRWNGSMTLHASDTGSFSTTSSLARHNVFLHNQGHIIAKAKIATPHIQGTNGYDSHGNIAFGYSRENGIAYPTIEAYADFQFHATALGLTNFEGGVRFGTAANLCLVAKTVDQSIPDNTTTVVAWDAVSYDWFSAGNATTDRITAPNGIKWVRFTYGAEWASNSTTGRFVGVRKNGTTIISKDQRGGYLNAQSTVTSQVFAVTPGDYYELVVSQNTGGALNLLGNTSTFLQAEWY